MNKTDEIDQKLLELIALVTNDRQETMTQVILQIVLGARFAGQDIMLAKHMQEYTKNVLLPDLKNKRIQAQIRKN